MFMFYVLCYVFFIVYDMSPPIFRGKILLSVTVGRPSTPSPPLFPLDLERHLRRKSGSPETLTEASERCCLILLGRGPRGSPLPVGAAFFLCGRINRAPCSPLAQRAARASPAVPSSCLRARLVRAQELLELLEGGRWCCCRVCSWQERGCS